MRQGIDLHDPEIPTAAHFEELAEPAEPAPHSQGLSVGPVTTETVVPEIELDLHPEVTPRSVHRFAVFTALVSFVAVVMGGAVTSSDSSLVDPSPVGFFGRWFPDLAQLFGSPGLFFEHGHRMLIGVTILGIFGLVGALWWVGERRVWVRRLGVGAVVVILLPAVLGALTVYLGKSPVISVIHVSLAMLFVASIWALAEVTGPRWFSEWTRTDVTSAKSLLGFATALLVILYVQIILGAVPRHATVEFGGRSLVLIGSSIHVLWAFLAFAAVILVFLEVTRNHRKTPQVFMPACGLLFLLIVQVFLGTAAFVTLPNSPPSSETLAAAGPVETVDVLQDAVNPAAVTPAVIEDAPESKPSTFHQLSASTHQAAGVLMFIGAVILALRATRIYQVSRDAARTEALARPDPPEEGAP